MRRIVITRAAHQAGEWADAIRARGDVPILYRCIRIAPPLDAEPLDAALRALNDFDWVVLTSANTAYALSLWFELMPTFPKVAVIGKSTAQAVEQFLGVNADWMPEEANGATLGMTLPLEAGMRVLLPQSALADHSLSQTLRERGAEVTTVRAYETVIGTGGEDVPTMLVHGEVDAILFSSPSTVHNFVQRIYPLPVPSLPAACIGATTAKAAREYPFSAVLQSETATIEGLLDVLNSYWAQHDAPLQKKS
jgi:uroporphyrinogen-III synthase